MARKIRNLWQKILSTILGLLGAGSLTSCVVAYGPAELMYGMVDMYGMPDPVDYPVVYGPAPVHETIRGTVVKGDASKEGSIEVLPVNEEEDTSEEETVIGGINNIQVILYDGKEIFDSFQTRENGEFYFDADGLYGKEITITCTDIDGEQNGKFKTVTKTFTLSTMDTKINVILQPGSEEQ